MKKYLKTIDDIQDKTRTTRKEIDRFCIQEKGVVGWHGRRNSQ